MLRQPAISLPSAAVALCVVLSAGTPGGLTGQAIPTQLRVRAVAHDAKIIGSGVGGARITVRDAASGRVLAQGIQEGSTGDTRGIVVEPVARGSDIFDTEGAAHFTVTLELEGPTTVEIVAEGPLATPHATQRSSKTMLLVPGGDVLGDGVILVLNGFTVEILAPSEVASAAEALDVRARVTMLCGCPTEPGGLWDSDGMAVHARLIRDGRVVVETPLRFSGERSVYEGSVPVPEEGADLLQVVASDPDRANFGMAELEMGG